MSGGISTKTWKQALIKVLECVWLPVGMFFALIAIAMGVYRK